MNETNLDTLLESLTEEQVDQLISEALESDPYITMINVKPKAKIPCAWKIDAPGNDNLLLYLSNYNSKSLNYKQIKPGDKFMQAWMLSLTSSGTAGVMKGNLGTKPFAVINAVFTQTMNTMYYNNMDGVLFRFQPKKLGGKEKKLYHLLTILLRKKGYASKYAVMSEMAELTGDKYYYMVIYNKARGLTGIRDIGMDMSLFNVAKTKVGEVVTDKSTGKEVTKAEAIAISVASNANKQSESAVAGTIHITKEDLIAGFSGFAVPSDQEDVTAKYEADRDAALSTDAKEISIPTTLEFPLDFIETAYSESDHKEKVTEVIKKYSRDEGGGYYIVPAFNDDCMAMVSEIARFDPQAAVDVISRLNIQMNTVYMSTYGETHDFSPAEALALGDYFGVSYGRINRLFTKNQEPDTEQGQMRIKNTIATLDNCFRTQAVTMTPGTRLYRGMTVPRKIGGEAVKNKAFYFRNYVSTSLKAICLTGYGEGEWSSRSLTDLAVGAAKNTYKSIDETDAEVTNFGFMVDPADVPCIVAGKYTEFDVECEVLMPRGTVFKFVQASYAERPIYQGESTAVNIFVRADAQHIKNFAESGEVIYDGDALINEGVVKPLSFNSFLAEKKAKKVDIDVDALARLISPNIPEKFNDVGMG